MQTAHTCPRPTVHIMRHSVPTGIHGHLHEQVPIMKCSQGVSNPDCAPPSEVLKRTLPKLTYQKACVHRRRGSPSSLLQEPEMCCGKGRPACTAVPRQHAQAPAEMACICSSHIWLQQTGRTQRCSPKGLFTFNCASPSPTTRAGLAPNSTCARHPAAPTTPY